MNDQYIPWWLPADHPLRSGAAQPEPAPVEAESEPEPAPDAAEELI